MEKILRQVDYLQRASVCLNKVKTILYNKFKPKENMPECRNINLQNKYITFETYTKTGLLVLKTEKKSFQHCIAFRFK